MNTTNIIVTGLESKAFTKKNGQAGRTYTIEANDGRKYVTWDAEFYNARTVGEQLALNYEVASRQWNGKTYTDYKIVTQPARGNTSAPAAAPADNKEVLEALRKVYERINTMERNLSAQITLVMGEVDIPSPEEVEAMPEEPEEVVEDKPSENVETELQPGDIPF
jgi:hypothetical protein